MEKVDYENAIYQIVEEAELGMEAERFIRMMEQMAEEFYDIANSTKQSNWRR